MAGSSGPVVCVSYLASAALWTVPRFPTANYGAEVLRIEQSIAADGPMAAAVLAALGVPTTLLANHIGDDLYGSQVANWLQRYRVSTSPDLVQPSIPTPQITIVADTEGTRTWFPYLPGVSDGLGQLDLTVLDTASLIYVDCYELIRASAIRAIRAARSAGAPLLLNLGGSPLSPEIQEAVRDHPGLVVQTNVDDAEHASAPEEAASLLTQTGAAWSIVTCGAYGATAVSRQETLSAPGYSVTVNHTHCAGAAFSGGLLYGLRAGWSMADSLQLGCASGSLRCARTHDQPMPTLGELREVIASSATRENCA